MRLGSRGEENKWEILTHGTLRRQHNTCIHHLHNGDNVWAKVLTGKISFPVWENRIRVQILRHLASVNASKKENSE